MIISLTSIEVEAFKAFTTMTVLHVGDFPCGLHFVRGENHINPRMGSNGSAKTTLLSDAVTWCLYGRTIGGLRTTDVQSWLTKNPPRVAATLVRDKTNHIVQRGPRASDLSINGAIVGQDDVTALVGLDFPAWAQAVVMGQGQPLFFDLAPRDKMQLLSDALGLERWERRAQAAGARAKRLEDRLKGLDGEVRGLEAAKEHAQNALEKAKGLSDAWGREQAARIDETASAARSARQMAISLEGKRGEAALAADSAGTARKMIIPTANELRALWAEQNLDEQKLRSEARAADVEVHRLEAEVSTLREEQTCPTCGQAVTKKNTATHAAEAMKKIARIKKQAASARAGADAVKAKASTTEKRLATEETNLIALEDVERKADGELRLLDRELGSAQAKAAAADENLRRAEAETNPHRQAAQDARTRLREVEYEIKEKTELSTKLAASVERAQFWARGFRDIRLGIIDDIINDLQETTAEVMDGLGLEDWEAEYSTERETKAGTLQRSLAVMIKSPSAPGWVRWESYSGGEQQRLRLAGALALSEVLLAHAGVTIDFRALDEPTRGLSHEGVRDLVDVLGGYAKDAGLKIFYVDHQTEDGLAFASTITVQNNAQGASISM